MLSAIRTVEKRWETMTVMVPACSAISRAAVYQAMIELGRA